jgi:hypothetical protein
MTCTTCHLEIPPRCIVCPNCAKTTFQAHLRLRQKDYLPRVVTGDVLLKLRWLQGGKAHLCFFTHDRLSYCGILLGPQMHAQDVLYEDYMRRPSACIDCRMQLNMLIQEMR